MLIICNGIFKSGSTWLHAVVLEIIKMNNIQLTDVPYFYTNNTSSPTTIIESKLKYFLLTEDYINKHYITKSHYYLSSTLKAKYDENIFFLFVERDVRDAVVSHFYHLNKKYKIFNNFNFYYYTLGRFKAYEILFLNNEYKKAFGTSSFFEYSQMKHDFKSVVHKLSSILKLKTLTQREIETIKKNTSINKMRNDLLMGTSKYYSTVKKNREKLIRKGEIGDWKNYFSKKQQHDIMTIELDDVTFLFRFFYYIFFTLRRRLFKIE